jgi:hypothetical protein
MKRTDNYYSTIQLIDGKPATDSDLEKLNSVRNMVKCINTYNKKNGRVDRPLYTKLHGRGDRYGSKQWRQELPLKYATSADIYVYERRVFNF